MIDIDWEYPGGNGQDYKKIPNDKKVSEIETYPLLLKAIRSKLPKEKLLSTAVPGREPDMIAYTPEKAPQIWESVDFVNVIKALFLNISITQFVINEYPRS